MNDSLFYDDIKDIFFKPSRLFEDVSLKNFSTIRFILHYQMEMPVIFRGAAMWDVNR